MNKEEALRQRALVWKRYDNALAVARRILEKDLKEIDRLEKEGS